MNPNPKTHDGLFKWLITSFTDEFFAHYFPNISIGKYQFIDKEFISRYEALKESLKGDLFLVMEIEIDDRMQEVVIQIEHKGKREDVSKKAGTLSKNIPYYANYLPSKLMTGMLILKN
ncbi:hypothetical protein QUF70_05940 [Desulfobacterales bacterium HSG17]|nr:hypothetical protein [Desulfobacterales bacterium HSG17]